MQLGNHSAPTQELPPMKRIRFIPAQIKTFPDERPDACKRRGSQILARHGTADKTATSLYDEKVTVVRYRRSACGSAFRRYPGSRPRRSDSADGLRSRGRVKDIIARPRHQGDPSTLIPHCSLFSLNPLTALSSLLYLTNPIR